jgi:hypothetical protein
VQPKVVHRSDATTEGGLSVRTNDAQSESSDNPDELDEFTDRKDADATVDVVLKKQAVTIVVESTSDSPELNIEGAVILFD